MNKTNLDYSDEVGELATQLREADEAAKRLAKHRKITPPEKPATSPTTATLSERSPAKPSSVAQPKKASEPVRQKAPKPRAQSPARRRPTAESQPPKDDPWVSASFKVRNSKKRRLHALSLRRQLSGLAPFKKQHLIDEAMQYLFDKYEGELRKVSSG